MESNGPIGDWGLASQAHELEVGFLGNRRGFSDNSNSQEQRRAKTVEAATFDTPVDA